MSAYQGLIELLKSQKYPPVHTWNPQREGVIDIRIQADGTWFHDGREITRKGIAKVFSSILRREGTSFYLVTPVEKLRIEVEDAPFIATDFEVQGDGPEQNILFKTNMDDVVMLGRDHPLTMNQVATEFRPYLEVRDGLQALITRSAFYRLADHAIEDGHDAILVSNGAKFRLS